MKTRSRCGCLLCGILLSAAGLSHAAEIAHGEPAQESAFQARTFAAAHSHLQNRFSPQQQALLTSLGEQVRQQLPRGAHLPEDARRILAIGFPSLTGVELDSLSAYVAGNLLSQTQQMQETQMSFNLQYLQLQESQQNEDREYSCLSNVLKTKQDTIKAMLGNIR
jgi:hypothetical protein